MNAALVRGLVLRWIARHKLRSALAVVAVALGVAVFLGSAAIGRSVVATAASATAAVAGGADLVVVGDEAGLGPDAVAAVRRTSGVAAAAPLVSGWVRVAGGEGRRVLLLGVDPAAELRMGRDGGARGRVEVRDPAAFALGTGGVAASTLLAELGAQAGGAVRVQGVRGAAAFAVAGTFDPPGGAEGPAGRALVVALPAAAAVLGRGGRVDRIDVALAPDADAARVADAVRAALPHAFVAPPGAADPTTGEVLGALETGLRIGALVSLLVGAFLVHHTVSVGVTERTREVGILRALGATRAQVTAVFCGEALALGAAGAALGAGLGLLLARTSLDVFAATISGAYFPARAAPVDVPVSFLLTGAAAGAATAVAAAWGPARRAARVAPNDAIRRGPEESSRTQPPGRARTTAAAALLALSAVSTATTYPRSGYVAAFALLGGFLLLAPSVLSLGARLLAPFLRRVAGVPGRLAADELARRPRRASLPAATLTIGLALVVETAA